MPLPEDEDTEEGEEKSPPSISHPITNGHEHHHLSKNSSTTTTMTTTLVGAKRRKCSLAHRIQHLEEKVKKNNLIVEEDFVHLVCLECRIFIFVVSQH